MSPSTMSVVRRIVWLALAVTSLAWTIHHARTDFHMALAGVAVFSFTAPAVFMDRAPRRERDTT